MTDITELAQMKGQKLKRHITWLNVPNAGRCIQANT